MTLFKNMRHALLRDTVTKLSMLVVVLWLCVALLPHALPELLPLDIDLPKTRMAPQWNLSEPSGWFGYDSVGTSVFYQVLSGAGVSLSVGLCTVLLSFAIGIPLGALAGSGRRYFDVLITRLMDILLSFPPLVLPIALTALLGGGFLNVVVALTVSGWIGSAKLVRAEFRALDKREFVEAARALGATPRRVMFVHMLPHAASSLLVHASFSLAGVILAEAGLSFLGLGLGDEHPSWGASLSEARAYLLESPHLAIFPSLALLSLVLALNFLAESLRASLDPKAGSA
ncbi:MAG: ABC transporter permease [Betaproteobacteria bacterium]|nr:ABC transporter permease [Betaproteobacteria bacterium]